MMIKPSITQVADQWCETARWDGEAIFQRTMLAFDAGDKENASLYLCAPSGRSTATPLGQAIDLLRANGLWSKQEPKWVRDDQRQSYQDQLSLVEVLPLPWNGEELLLVRCEHPRFPSSEHRFAAWKAALGATEAMAAPSASDVTSS